MAERASEALLALTYPATKLRSPPAPLDGGIVLELLEDALRHITRSRQSLIREAYAPGSEFLSLVHEVEELQAAASTDHPADTWRTLLRQVYMRLVAAADEIVNLVRSRGLSVDPVVEREVKMAMPHMQTPASDQELHRRLIRECREQTFIGHFGRLPERLERADQLPELSEDDVNFWWDRYWTQGDPNDPGRDDDEITVCVLGVGETVIWRELADPSFELRAGRALKERLGHRFGKLEQGWYRGPRRSSIPFD